MIGKKNFWTKFLKSWENRDQGESSYCYKDHGKGQKWKQTTACLRCQNFWHLYKWSPTWAEKKSQTLEVDFPPHAVCSTCLQYQLNLKTKEHLQMKIKDLRSIVRELVLGVKGRKRMMLFEISWGMPLIVSFKERSAVTRRSITYNYEGLRLLYLHSTINFGVNSEAWHVEFQHLHPDVLN